MTPRPLNILLLVPSWHPPVDGGVKASARTLAKELAKMHVVSVFVGSWEHATPVESVDDQGIRIVERRVRSPAGGKAVVRALIAWLIDLPAFLLQFRKLCRERQIDIIHVQQLNAAWFNLALAALLGAPAYTVGMHGGETRGFAGAGRLSRLCTRILLKGASAAIAVSNELAARARVAFSTSATIVAIPNGVSELCPNELEAELRKCGRGEEIPQMFFLSVGSLLPVKGHDLAIRSWNQVLKARPECHLIIVGEGECRANLERLIVECGCESRVRLLGAETTAAVRLLMSQACGLVHPSRHEGLPLVLLEAGLAGCPVIAANVGGIPEVIENEESGLLVDPENGREIADAVLRVLEDRELATRMAQRLAARVHSDFTAEAMARKYASVFQGIVGLKD